MRPETGGRSGAPAGSRAATAATPSPTATSRRCTSIPSGEGPENACALDSRASAGRQRPDPVSPEAVPLPSLLQEFASIPDHRRPQGRKFQLPNAGDWELARLSGYRGVDATWRYACALNQEGCAPSALGATRGPVATTRRRSHPASSPDEPPRRLRPPSTVGLSLPIPRWRPDGKRLRGANRQGEAHYQTVSLVNHANAMPMPLAPTPNREERSPPSWPCWTGRRPRLGDHSRRLAYHPIALAIRHRHRAPLPVHRQQRAGNLPDPGDHRLGPGRLFHFCENDEKAHGRILTAFQVLKPLRGLINYPRSDKCSVYPQAASGQDRRRPSR